MSVADDRAQQVTAAQAPLPIEELASLFADDLSEARGLPRQAYLSEELHTWEERHLFGRTWTCVGRSDLVREPGAQRSFTVGGQSVILARAADGQLHGFFNSCRHRGHELLTPGSCWTNRRIVCPYHAWVYELDGTLVSATKFEGADVPADQWSLIPVDVHEWYGWVFVAVSQDAVAFEDWIGNLTEVLAPWDPTELVAGGRHEYVVEANWKSIVENYAECYHCPSIHPELCAVSATDSDQGWDSTGYWIGGPLDLLPNAQSMSLSGSAGVRLPGVGEDLATSVHYFMLPPGLLVAAHPDYVMTHRLQPLGPTRTLVECTWLFPPDVVGTPGFDPSDALEFWDRTNKQDFGACESITRGMRTDGFRPGVFDRRESIVRAFQAQVAHVYVTGHWDKPRV